MLGTAATTHAAADETAVSVVATPDHDFAAIFSTGGHTVDVTGVVHELPDTRYQVKVVFNDQVPARGSEHKAATTVEVKAGETI